VSARAEICGDDGGDGIVWWLRFVVPILLLIGLVLGLLAWYTELPWYRQ
jgi:hypothetical protein